MELQQVWNTVRNEVEAFIDHFLPPKDRPPRILNEAMRYAVFSGGKRIRPLLVYLGYQLESGKLPLGHDKAIKTSSSIELIHTFTLVHDDLPALDNDIERRGKPTVHVKFGEDIAILAGDALFAYALNLLVDIDKQIQRIITESLIGVIEGQVYDLREDITSPEEVLRVHQFKTGELMKASLLSGYLLAGGKNTDTIEKIAYSFGRIFQITDDIIDAREGKVEKASIMRFMSEKEARSIVEQELEQAIQLLDTHFPATGHQLKNLFQLVAERNK